MVSKYETSHTLLNRACDPQDEQAWNEFEKRYSVFISYILGQLGVPFDERADLAQQILVKLTSDLPKYDKERAKFRTWFSQVIRNQSKEYFRERQRSRTRVNRYAEENPELFDFESPQVDEMIQQEWETYVSTLAMERVRKVYNSRAIQVFEESLAGCPPAEIAEKTGLTLASVYTLKKRVKKSLFMEVRNVVAELEY